jgi:hypothetical protein
MTRTPRPVLTAAAILVGLTLSHPAAAEAEPAALPYDQFERAVPHVDLASCPAEFGDEDYFCRATFSHAEMHVFVFSYDGDMPFVAMRTYPAMELDALYD